MKSIILAGATLGILSAGAAVAGPYANVESNSGFSGGDYDSTLLETHLGYESALGNDSSWYIQGGPAFGFVPDEDAEQYLSGKVGVSWDVSEPVTIYGEVSALTGDDLDFDSLGLGVKAGLIYRF